MPEKMRVHILAKELNVPSKTIIEKCKAEGITAVKNHMSTLGPGLHATIREWFSNGSEHTAVETAERVDLERVRIKPKRRKKATVPADKRPTPQEVGVEIAEPMPAKAPAPAAATVAATTAPPLKRWLKRRAQQRQRKHPEPRLRRLSR